MPPKPTPGTPAPTGPGSTTTSTGSGAGGRQPVNPSPSTSTLPTSHPGYNPAGGTPQTAYDEWWAFEVQDGWIPGIMSAYPELSLKIKAAAWQYMSVGNTNGFYDWLERNGIAKTDGSGGGGGRGGGGGGVSKEQQYLAAQAAIRNEASKLGLEINDASVVTLSKVVVDNSWSNDQLMDYLVPGAKNTTAAGTITISVDQIKKMAANQLLNVSDATAREWASKIASDEMTLDAVGSLLQAQATLKYGWAASQIGQGVSVRDMMLPGRDVIARELEMDPESIDLMDGKWLGMLQTADSSNGTVRAATESELTMRARKDERWAKTRNATVAASRSAAMMRNFFGV
jgi:hypothetical protein